MHDLCGYRDEKALSEHQKESGDHSSVVLRDDTGLVPVSVCAPAVASEMLAFVMSAGLKPARSVSIAMLSRKSNENEGDSSSIPPSQNGEQRHSRTLEMDEWEHRLSAGAAKPLSTRGSALPNSPISSTCTTTLSSTTRSTTREPPPSSYFESLLPLEREKVTVALDSTFQSSRPVFRMLGTFLSNQATTFS